jgi:hypothetical protein
MVEWKIINSEEKPHNIHRQEFKKPQSGLRQKLYCNVLQWLCEKYYISGLKAMGLVHIKVTAVTPTVIYMNSITEWTAKNYEIKG